MRANSFATLLLCLTIAPGGAICADEEILDDDFLEFLGVWDAAWSEACGLDGGLPEDDACTEYEDEQDESDEN